MQQITPSQIPVIMSIRRQDNNDNITTAEAGTLVYIRLEMTIATNYRGNAYGSGPGITMPP